MEIVTAGMFALCVGLMLFSACEPAPIAPIPNTNVVLIVVDTMRADATDGSFTETPALQALAAEGVRFEQAFSHAPSTLPSHTALFSSRPPHETGVLNNGVDVPESLPLLAEHLQTAGYQTHAVVSLGTLNRRLPNGNPGLTRGFDVFDQDYWYMENAGNSIARMGKQLDLIDPARPFFLFAHFSDPHAPYSARFENVELAKLSIEDEWTATAPISWNAPQWQDVELNVGKHTVVVTAGQVFHVKDFDLRASGERLQGEWIDGDPNAFLKQHTFVFNVGEVGSIRIHYWFSKEVENQDVRSNYQSEVEYVDKYIGALIGDLKQRGLYETSLVIFTSDHGEALGEGGRIGHVQTLGDELLHVPLMIKLPVGHGGKQRLLEQADRLVPHMDLVPTILDVIGLPALPGQRGTSLMHVHDSVLMAETHTPEAKRNILGLRDDRYKMILWPKKGIYVMFDMLSDAGEKRDVFPVSRGQRKTWPKLLSKYNQEAMKSLVKDEALPAEDGLDLKALGYAGADEEN